jgi:lactoylglutathione lyase
MRAIFLVLIIFIGNVSFSASAQEESLTTGFNHIGLTVNKLDLSTRFFVEALGWKQVGGDPSYPAKFVSDGNMFITLWQATDPATAVKFNRKNNVGLHHLAITVASFEALDTLYERVKAFEGVEIEFSPELAYGGPGKHMMIREPSGNRLEFTYRPPRQ